MAGNVTPSSTVKVLCGAGYLAATQSDYPRAESLCGEALEIARELNDDRSIALALLGLANAANWKRDPSRAKSLFETSLEIYRRLNDVWGIANTLVYLGNVLYFQGEYEGAGPLFDEALMLFSGMDQVGGTAFTLYSRGLLAVNRNDLKSAQRDLETSQAYLRQLGDRRGLIRTSAGLAKIAIERRHFLEARALILEAMTLTREVGDRWSASIVLDLMGSLSVQQKQTPLAAQFFGAAHSLRTVIDAPLSPAFLDWRERDFLSLRDALPPERLARSWAEGQNLTPESATALFETTRLTERPSAPYGELTAREIEVLRLVSSGVTDAEIAEHLVVSVRTVNAHLRSIYQKLGVSSRTAAARWGIKNGLVPDE